MSMGCNALISYQNAVKVIRRLLEVAEQRHTPFEEPKTTILQECIDLLNCRIPFADWLHDARVAFLLAIQSGEGREARKAYLTARYLRINGRLTDDDVLQTPTPLNAAAPSASARIWRIWSNWERADICTYKLCTSRDQKNVFASAVVDSSLWPKNLWNL